MNKIEGLKEASTDCLFFSITFIIVAAISLGIAAENIFASSDGKIHLGALIFGIIMLLIARSLMKLREKYSKEIEYKENIEE